MDISDIFKIKKGITSIIGGGGKTSLMYALGKDLSSKGNVILCTSAKILIPKDIPVIEDKFLIPSALEKRSLICVGSYFSEKKLTCPKFPIEELKNFADYILVEADGSKSLPFKAHLDFEPPIPSDTDLKILVMGINSLEKPISQTCHRPEKVSEILKVSQSEILTEALAASIINFENLHDILFINQVENEKDFYLAKNLSKLIKTPVIIGSIKKGWFKWLS